jgi:hypothetical protein
MTNDKQIPIVFLAAVNPVGNHQDLSVSAPVVDNTHPEDEDIVVASDGAEESSGANDSFTAVMVAAADPPLMVDRQFLDRIAHNSNRRSGPPSVATTALASAVGSVVGAPRDAFLKSITFLKDQPPESMGWGVRFADPITRRSRRQKLHIDSVEGIFAVSRIQEGDYLKSINQKRCGPSLNAERALERMNQCLTNEGVLSVAVENKELGDDILVQATIIKPRPNMTYEELGMVVWVWGYLCIKSIDKQSIFKHSVLKSTDHIISINDILCDGMTPEQFADIIQALPIEVTLTVLRRKQRLSGMFG